MPLAGTGDGYSFRDDYLQVVGLNAVTQTQQINVEDYSTIVVVVSGTFVGTLVPEVSADNFGNSTVAVNVVNEATQTPQATITAPGTYVFEYVGGMSQARVRCSAYTSGTINVLMHALRGLSSLALMSIALRDGASGNLATIFQAHNTDNQALGSAGYALNTGGIAQLLNAAGNLDRQREVGQDGVPAIGIATGGAQFAMACGTTDAENKAAGANTVFTPAAMSGVTQGVPWSIQPGSVVLLDANTFVVTINGAPTGGTFTLSFGGQTTSGIAYNASAATVQTAVTGLSSVGSGNATVSGSAGGPYTITLHPQLAANMGGLSSNGASLTGGTSPTATTVRNSEAVVVTATTATTFTATTAKAHNGTSTPVGIQAFVFNQERDCTGELSGASGAGTALAAEMHYNSGGPAQGNNYDRACNLQGKGYSTGTVSSGGGAGSISVTLSSAPTGLQPGAPVYFTDGTAEVAMTSPAYAAGSNPILLQSPLQNSHSGSNKVGWDVYAAQGPGTNGFSPSGLGIEEEAVWDPINQLFYLERAATADGMAAQNIVAEAPSLWNGATMDRMRSHMAQTIFASASQTTTQTSADITNVNGRFLDVILDMTVVGTGSVTITINGKDPASGKYYPLLVGAAVTSNSTNVYRVGPGLTASANAVANYALPRTLQIVVTANNANAATYSVGANIMS